MPLTLDTYKQDTCRYCDGHLPEPFLELGTMPLANSFLTESQLKDEEFVCPLSLTFCPSCYLVQLSHVVPPDLMFKHYLYVSSTTKTFHEHFGQYAEEVRGKLSSVESPLAVDIGSNDGLLVNSYQKQGMRALGVDPADNLAEEANKKGITTLNRYFDADAVNEIKSKWGKAHAVSGNNVFAHIHDVQSVCQNVSELLEDDGFFVIEFPYLMVMLDDLVFDMIYHEHLSYISISALQHLYSRFNLEVFDVKQVASHGGSLRVYAQKKKGPYSREAIVDDLVQKEKERGCLAKETFETFAGQVNQIKQDLLAFVNKAKAEGKSVAGYGAPAKAGTIINFCEFNETQIDYIVDDNPLKQYHFSPGARIPIVPSSHLENNVPDYLIIFAWNFAKEIIAKIEPLREKGVQFIIPLPKPEVI